MNRINMFAYFVLYVVFCIKSNPINMFQLLVGFGLLVIISMLSLLNNKE